MNVATMMAMPAWSAGYTAQYLVWAFAFTTVLSAVVLAFTVPGIFAPHDNAREER